MREVVEIEDKEARRLAGQGVRLRAEVRARLDHQFGDGEPERLGAVVGALWQDLERSVTTAQGRLRVQLSCQKGCHACCRKHVAVRVTDLILLYGAMVMALPKEEQAALRARTAARAAAIRGTTSARRLRERLPCALLQFDGTCLGYDVRPGRCRGENSTGDPERCGPPPGRPSGVWVDKRSIFEQADEEVGAWLEAHDLDGGKVELTLGLHILLSDDTALLRWRAGDRFVFAPARIDDSPVVRAGSRHLPLLPSERR